MKRLCGMVATLDELVATSQVTDAARVESALDLLCQSGMSYWEIGSLDTLTDAVPAAELKVLAQKKGIKLIGRLPFALDETPDAAAARAQSFAIPFDAVILSEFGRYDAAQTEPDPARAKELSARYTETVKAVRLALKGKELIADDASIVSPAINKLLSDNGLICTRVMERGFYGRNPQNRHLPHAYSPNTAAYLSEPAGIMEFLYHADPLDAGFAVDYLNLSEREGYVFGFLRGLYASPASLALVHAKDIATEGDLLSAHAEKRLRYYARLFGRLA